jgi:hypothetical protein
MRLRFSLQALLVVFTLAVALCVWRDGPRRVAHEFADAVNSGRHAAADQMHADAKKRQLAEFFQRDDRNRISAKVRSQSAKQWISGECIVEVDFVDFGGLGGNFGLLMAAHSDGVVPAGSHVIWATRAELLEPEIPMSR